MRSTLFLRQAREAPLQLDYKWYGRNLANRMSSVR